MDEDAPPEAALERVAALEAHIKALLYNPHTRSRRQVCPASAPPCQSA